MTPVSGSLKLRGQLGSLVLPLGWSAREGPLRSYAPPGKYPRPVMTNARVLELLALLGSRPSWSGTELAQRLEVSGRTLRRDITALQDLGYPIVTMPGTGGGYRLDPGAALPPLPVTSDEGVILAWALREFAASTTAGLSQQAQSVLEKVLGALSTGARRRAGSMQHLSSASSVGARADIDVAVLSRLATAVRDGAELEIAYGDRDGNQTTRGIEPHAILTHNRRLYLVAHDGLRQDWRLFRLDRITTAQGTGRIFRHRPLPYTDPVDYLERQLTAARRTFQVTATVQAPAGQVARQLKTAADVISVGPDRCEVTMPADDLDWALFVLVTLHADFTVDTPEEARQAARTWSLRLRGATEDV